MIAPRIARTVAILLSTSVALVLQSCVGIFNDHPGARGRVVDARTGQPVSRAQIIAGTAYDGKLFRTRRDGTFSIPQRSSLGVTVLALAPAGDNLFISAPGYRTAHIKLREIPPTGRAPQQELGTIRLSPVSR
jgi:hypothetical protein